MPTAHAAGSRARGLVILLVLVLLAGLPLAVWMDLRNLTDTALRRQASDLNSASCPITPSKAGLRMRSTVSRPTRSSSCVNIPTGI